MKASTFIILVFVQLAISSDAGQLSDKWSGTIEFIDNCPMVVCVGSFDRQTLQWERWQQFSWQIDFQKYVTVDVTDGNYVIGMKTGMLNLFGSYDWHETLYNPTTSTAECSWFSSCEGSLQSAGPGGTLSIAVADDNSYRITIDGLQTTYEGYYHLAHDTRSSESCGYVDLEGPLDKNASDDSRTIAGVASDPDKLAGAETPDWNEGAPAWYAAVVSELVNQLSRGTTPTQAATIRTVSSAGAPVHLRSSHWNLQRPPRYWAGSITMTRVMNLITNSSRASAPRDCYANETESYDHGYHLTNKVTLTLPASGASGQANGTYYYFGWTTNVYTGLSDCNCPFTPPDWRSYQSEVSETNTQQGEGSGSCGKVEVIVFGGAGGRVSVSCPFDLTMSGTMLRTTTRTSRGGCSQNTSSTTNVFAHQKGEAGLAMTADLSSDGERITGEDRIDLSYENHPLGKLTGYLLMTCDLQLVSSGQAARLVAISQSQARPLVISGGTIDCDFNNQFVSSNSVPDGLPQAGLVYQTESTIAYAASITNINGGFEAMVRASESSYNQTDATQTVVCTEWMGESATQTTNNVPINLHTTITAGVTNPVPVVISVLLEGDQYRAHVEIAAPRNGRSLSVQRIVTQPSCAPFSGETEHTFVSDHWTPGSRILEFQGVIDPSDPLTLAGSETLSTGTIQWKLKSATSPFLTLRVTQNSDVLALSWEGGQGIYLQETASLTNSVWLDVPGSGNTNALMWPFGAGDAFFRLIKR